MMDQSSADSSETTAGSSVHALPEGRWFWRRLYVFSSTFALWALLRHAVTRTPADRLPQVTEGLIQLLALVLVLYLIAPSAQQLIEMLAAVRLRLPRRGAS